MRRLTLLTLLSLVGACRLPPLCPACPPPTATPPPASTPTPRPEATPTRTPTPGAVEVRQFTSGRAVFEVDLTEFKADPDLDAYAGTTICWSEPTPGPVRVRPDTPCLQLGTRGHRSEPCEHKPCDGRQALEVRYSASLRYDGTPGLPEEKMCGEGTKPPRWLPLGPAQVVRVSVDWGPGFVRVETPAGSVTLSQGAAGPGFGWWSGDGPALGIGWVWRPEWTLQKYGGRVRLLSWEAVGEQPEMGACGAGE